MRSSILARLTVVLAGAVGVLSLPGEAMGQGAKPKDFTIQFKIFPANDPTGTSLTPFEQATIHYRNKVESLPDLKFDLPVAGPDAKGFYSVTVQEGWLIDNLVIRVKGAVNPAVVAKLVTHDSMVLYPGASDSNDKFKFPNYTTQMGVYRNLFREFVEDAPPAQRERNRVGLLNAFQAQLNNMANVRDRLPEATESEIATAIRLKDEVIRLYFNLPEVPQPQICPPVSVCSTVNYYPAPRRGLLGRLCGR